MQHSSWPRTLWLNYACFYPSSLFHRADIFETFGTCNEAMDTSFIFIGNVFQFKGKVIRFCFVFFPAGIVVSIQRPAVQMFGLYANVLKNATCLVCDLTNRRLRLYFMTF